MKNNMFMALATGMLNALALVATALIPLPEIKQVVMALVSLVSPFLSIWLLKVYIRADDPPELTRSIAGLKTSIGICQSHLKDESSSEEFKAKTRAQLEEFKTALQKIRSSPAGSGDYAVMPLSDQVPRA
jgi:hypothetical protein